MGADQKTQTIFNFSPAVLTRHFNFAPNYNVCQDWSLHSFVRVARMRVSSGYCVRARWETTPSAQAWSILDLLHTAQG